MTSITNKRHNAQADVATASASKYLQQLCKHFGHKVEATCDTQNGEITFPLGKCTLTANDTALVMSLDCNDAEALERLKDVLASHLVRFAFREKLDVPWIDS